MITVDKCYARLGTWRLVCEVVGIRPRQMLRIRNYEQMCINQGLYRKFCAVVGADIEEVNWYTAEELIARGYWQDLYGQPTWTNDGKRKKWTNES